MALAASDDPSNSALGRGGSTDDRCRPSPCCATMTRSSSSKRLATLWFCQRDDRSRGLALPTNVSPKPGAQRQKALALVRTIEATGRLRTPAFGPLPKAGAVDELLVHAMINQAFVANRAGSPTSPPTPLQALTLL